jgi:hypothetical protein
VAKLPSPIEAPPLSLADLSGKLVELRQLRGGWAWCTSGLPGDRIARGSLPSINALQAGLDEDKLAVLLVDISESRETVARVVTSCGYTARVLLDSDGRASRA